MKLSDLIGLVLLWTVILLVLGVVLVLVLGFVGNVLVGMRQAVREDRRRANRCLACGYPLKGNRSGRCPECGRAIPPPFAGLPTEGRLAASESIDTMSIPQALAVMNAEDAAAAAAVARERDNVAAAVDLVANAFTNGGRLIYVGAGTSGRLGVLDASECPPTFRTPPEQVQAVMAGGDAAVFRAAEGAEDDAAAGADAIDARSVGPADVVVGIAASGQTPFVIAALKRAIACGAKTVLLACVPAVGNEPRVNVQIRPITGPEVLTGSTRLKAGTATKLVLNQITTLAMIRTGKTYGNRMVDLRATNAKLRARAERMVADLAGVDAAAAAAVLADAGGHVKVAVVMARRHVSADAAHRLLAAHAGRLRPLM